MTIDVTTDVVAQSVAVYSDHAADYEAYNADKMGDKVVRFMQRLKAGSAVLDAGCGPGRDLERFTLAGLDAIGLDLNPDFVALANERGEAVLGDLRDLPFDDGMFAGVWACASLVHLPVADAVTALSEIARVLAPGGVTCISIKHAGQTGWSDTPHGRRWFQIWDPSAFEAAVADAGLVVQTTSVENVFVDVWATKPR